MSTWRKAAALLSREERARGLLVLCLLVVAALFDAIGVASIMPFLAVLADPGVIHSNRFLADIYNWLGFESDTNFLIALGSAALAVMVIAASLRTLSTYAINRYVHMRHHSLGLRLLETYLRQPYEFFLGRHSGEMTKGIISEVQQVVAQFFRPAATLVTYGTVIVALLVLLVIVDPVVTLIAFLVVSIAYAGMYMAIRQLMTRIGREKVAANEARFKLVSETLGNVKIIKLRALERNFLSRFRTPSKQFARHTAVNLTLSQVPKYAIETVAFGGIILLCLILLFRQGDPGDAAISSILPILGLYVFAGYKLLPAVQNVYAALATIRFGTASVESVYADISRRNSLPEILSGDVEKIRVKRQVKLDRVTYTYPGTATHGIHDVSLAIPEGTVLGIAGSTGAGKTTLVDVLLGLLVPQSGRIIVDGVALGGSDLRGWQRTIGYVPQEIFLLDRTIAENIAMGSDSTVIDQQGVETAARMAQIHEFITTELAQGYDTKVGERGIRLSGGQRQRLGIARALYHDPDVIVFDEATSALDNLTEAEVMQAVGAMSGRKTIIMIAHRLSTLKVCEQIILLKQGRIVERGSFKDLVETSGHFSMERHDVHGVA